MRKIILTLALIVLAMPAYAADECKAMPRKFPKAVANGDTLPINGALIRPDSANLTIDAGNSESFTVPEGTDYLQVTVSADVWVRVSAAGSSAVVDQDEFIPSGGTLEITDIYENGESRKIRAGDILKCVADS